jgi:hypothetical protein
MHEYIHFHKYISIHHFINWNKIYIFNILPILYSNIICKNIVKFFQSLMWDIFKHAHLWKVVQCDTPKEITIMYFHPLPVHSPWPPTYMGLVHNPFRYFTFIHMYKIYIQIYKFHIIHVGKGDWTLVRLAPHQFFDHWTTTPLCKTYDNKWI